MRSFSLVDPRGGSLGEEQRVGFMDRRVLLSLQGWICLGERVGRSRVAMCVGSRRPVFG